MTKTDEKWTKPIPPPWQEEIASRARIGAQMLDQFRDGWWTEINASELALSSCEMCIVGQLYTTKYEEHTPHYTTEETAFIEFDWMDEEYEAADPFDLGVVELEHEANEAGWRWNYSDLTFGEAHGFVAPSVNHVWPNEDVLRAGGIIPVRADAHMQLYGWLTQCWLEELIKRGVT